MSYSVYILGDMKAFNIALKFQRKGNLSLYHTLFFVRNEVQKGLFS